MAPIEPWPIVVCDAGPLIHLEELRSLRLLADASEIVVPGAVWQEVQRHQPTALRHRRIRLSRVDRIPEPVPELVALIGAHALDTGEQEALCLMQQFTAATLLTDDGAARLAAMQLGYRVHGTIGVIIRAMRRHQRTKRQVLNLLRSIPERSTLYISAALLNSVTELVRASSP